MLRPDQDGGIADRMQQQTSQKNALCRFLQRLIDDDSKAVGHSKRRHERHLCILEAEACVVARRPGKNVVIEGQELPDNFTVFLKDISRSGISFVYEFALQPQDIICIKVVVNGELRTYHLRIMRCRRVGLKVFDVGGEFITEEEAESLRKAAGTANKNQQDG